MRFAIGVLLAALLGLSGCSTITDPLDRRGQFEDTQEAFTQYVRWGRFDEASQFVDPEMREQFMSYAPEFSDLRFSEYQIIEIDMREGLKSASVQVRYTGYRLSMPFEKTVSLTEEWTRDEDTGVWTVKLDIEKLRDTMIGTP
jgi:hypothetical protein